MSPPRQCEGYNARVVSLCFSKGCVYTVQTPEGVQLFIQAKAFRDREWVETKGSTWGRRMILRDKRERGGDKQGWRESIYRDIAI